MIAVEMILMVCPVTCISNNAWSIVCISREAAEVVVNASAIDASAHHGVTLRNGLESGCVSGRWDSASRTRVDNLFRTELDNA